MIQPGYSAILLNYDFTFLCIISWKRAIQLVLEKKAIVIEESDRVVRSAKQLCFLVPKVLKLVYLVKVGKRRFKKARLTKRNIFIRDQYRCVYCGSSGDLTIDHVIPLSRGGTSRFENVVTCCNKCNEAKGNKTPDEAKMKLRKEPFAPTSTEILLIQTKNYLKKLKIEGLLNYDQETR